ncbi:MAG: hypothetical protein J0L84_03210 [Verrucomicrobia bacterium]|nr:hypothetical protein [Verrucomicrobiota bacterium]
MIPDMDNVPAFIASTLAAAPVFSEKGIRLFNPEQPDHGSGIVVHGNDLNIKIINRVWD